MNKKSLTLTIICIVLCTLILHFLRQTEFYNTLLSLFDNYLLLLLKTLEANSKIFNKPLSLDGFNVITSTGISYPFNVRFLMKKWLLALLLLAILTPNKLRTKVKYTLLVPFYHYIVISIRLILTLLLFQNGVSVLNAELIGKALATLLFFIAIPYWNNQNPIILKWLSQKIKINLPYLQKKFTDLTYIFYFLIFLNFINGIFDYKGWINIIFTISHNILNVFGYDSKVMPFQLYGANGSIFMAKGCLGIMTTYLFVSFIILTGENKKGIIKYSLIGVLIINLANILRFVFLFMHLQDHGAYLWKMEVHDLFNVIIYAIVLFLWIIWIDKYSDIWPYIKNRQNTPVGQ